MMTSKPNCQHHIHQQKIASPGGTEIQKNFTFLPMLCSTTSTKQVKLTHRRCSSSSSTVTEEPSSPKVGCMGQVKRNNKVVNFPSIISFTTTSTTSSSSYGSTNNPVIKCHEANNYTSNSIVKYHKIKRFFSIKSPTSVIAVTRPNACGPQKGKTRSKNIGSNNVVCRSKVDKKNIINSGNNENSEINNKGSLINLVEMDPPLPVMKKVVKREQGNDDGESASTLWKRRSGGAPLKSLRVEVIPQKLSILPANTV